MNIRKHIDYSEMYESLDKLMVQQLPQMELYCKIGKVVSWRSEKGAAVAAAEYLSNHYPDVQGFSPRNLRRMRDFYRAYEGQPALLSLALQLGWTQSVVILEADLPMELRGWYLKAVCQYGWSKAELNEKIANNAHDVIVLDNYEKARCGVEQEGTANLHKVDSIYCKENRTRQLIQMVRLTIKLEEGCKRIWPIRVCPLFIRKGIAFMRC